jgi:UDP-N-acetylmuramate--alanine ligase
MYPSPTIPDMISRIIGVVWCVRSDQMPISVDFSGRAFHFIGIGGIGMSALAYILAQRKLPVFGSDIKASHITQRLQAMGAHIFWQQDASNFDLFQSTAQTTGVELPSCLSGNGVSVVEREICHNQNNGKGKVASPTHQLPQVICSTAINTANSEYRAALALGCPMFHRSDVLAALIDDYQSIAVAGTHGKTTTSSMIGFVLLEAGLDPTIIVGGEVNAWSGNARLGDGPYLVAEADESDGSLVKFSPSIGVITNIELDHPDHYHSLDAVIETFKTFAQKCENLVGCIDCPTVKDALKPSITYSLNLDAGADYTVDSIDYRSDCTVARVWERGEILGELQLNLLGSHNLSNSLAAVAIGRLLGLDFDKIANAIGAFEGARRRFEIKGFHNNTLFVDDYAHHPSEIRVTLAAARLRVEGKKSPQQGVNDSALPVNSSSFQRVIAIFQPHRYSRTQTFLAEFAQAFQDADVVVLTDIYSAGEPQREEISGQILADLMAKYHPKVYYQPTARDVSQFLLTSLKPGDVALFLGAGNLNQIIPDVIVSYQEADQSRLTSASL